MVRPARTSFVGVIGDNECSEEIARLAEEVGRLLAQRGAVVVCGGLGGVMTAACKGAQEAGGLTVGILPGDDPKQANPFVTIPIVTGLGEARNVLVVKSSQVLIAVHGGYGTLSEIAIALRINRPVVGLRTWELARDGRADTAIVVARTPAEAVEKALALAS